MLAESFALEIVWYGVVVWLLDRTCSDLYQPLRHLDRRVVGTLLELFGVPLITDRRHDGRLDEGGKVRAVLATVSRT
jgi:hypothetical protein